MKGSAKSTSQQIYAGPARAPHRSLLRALGVGRGDAGRPLIGICNSYNELIPGHMHLNTIAQQVKYGVYQAGGLPLEFDVIGVCDGRARIQARPGVLPIALEEPNFIIETSLKKTPMDHQTDIAPRCQGVANA